MATAATSLLGLALPVTGELSGTWGDTVNVSITALLDSAVAGTTTLSSDADVTLTTTTLAANQARQAIILWTAGGTATRTITAPAQSKSYIVINKTSSSQSIKIVGAGPTTGVTIVAGTAAFVVWNGVDFVTASVTSTTGILPVANGGTGLSSGTSGGVLAYTATGTLASSAALAASALVIGGGAGAAPSTTTTGTGVVTALGVNTGTAGAFVVNGGALGTPSSGTVTNLTGTASININGTVGATTASTGAFTTLSATGDITFGGNLNSTLTSEFYLQSPNGNNFVGINQTSAYVRVAAAGQVVLNLSNTAATFYLGGAEKMSLTSTGLAVTGTLSATGAITGAAGSFSTITATGSIQGQASNAFTTSSNSGQYYHFDNASGSNFMGLSAANVVDLYAGGALSATFRSTGLAVTGTLSSTLGATIQSLTVGLGAGAVATNTAVGASALGANTTGSRMTVLGYQAGNSNVTNSFSAYVGYRAGANVIGDLNVAIGDRALEGASGSTVTQTVAIGQGVLAAVTSGNSMVGIGYNALAANTSGTYNVAVGQDALKSNTTASNNTAVGYQAGYTNSTGASNTFVGHTAGYTSNYNGDAYNTALGERAGYSLNTGTINTFVGSGAGYYVSSGSKNTIIGRYSGNQSSLDIRTSSNQIVLSDGDGKPYIGRIGGNWDQIPVSTSMVALTPASGVGMYASINGYNTANGAQGNWIVIANGSSGASVVAANNGTGLTVSFDYAGGQIRMSTTSGTLYVSSFFAY